MISKHASLLTVGILLLISTVSGQVECPVEGISYFPHPECNWYYICADGRPTLLPCPGGLYYNPIIHECDFPENVPECEGGTRPPISEPTVPTTTTIPTTTVPTSTTTPTPEPEPTEAETTVPPPTTTTPQTEPTEPEPEPTEPTTAEPPSNILQNCGQTYIGNEGTVEYKMGYPYVDYERCSFLIRSVDHTSFLFTLEVSGIIDDPTLQGGAINIFSFDGNGLVDSAHLGPPNPLNTTFVQGSVAIVVFKTEVFRGTGFRLRFQGNGLPPTDMKNFEDRIFSTVPSSLAYPAPGQYLPDTASFFIISNEHRRVENLLDTLHLTISSIDVNQCDDLCTCDYLEVFSFDSGALLNELQKVCTQDGVTEFDTRGIFVLFFRTTADEPKVGFELNWNIKSNAVEGPLVLSYKPVYKNPIMNI